MPFQPAGETVLVGSWMEDDDFAVHPKGSQPKKVLTCPDATAEPHLIPGHSYIFKTAKKDWQANQLWSEVIAYRLGSLMGLEVPPCFVAMDETSGQVGVLMEFFFGYPGEEITPRLIHGGDILARVIADRKKGRPHGVRTNVTVCRRYGFDGVEDWWGAALAFDAMIANVDRHPDNWGVLATGRGDQRFRMAPLFDNGTSLGYGLADDKLGLAETLSQFLSKGRHHAGWDVAEDGPTPHIDLCERYLSAYPEAIPHVRNVIRFENAELDAMLQEMVTFEIPVPLSEARAAFVGSIIKTRKDALVELVGAQQ